MTIALSGRTAAATIEQRAKKAHSKSPPCPTATVIEFRDATWDHEIAISPGSVFVKQGTGVPKSTGFQLERFGHWNLIAGLQSFEIAKSLGEHRWYLSFIVPAVQALGFAFNSQVAVRKAVRHLMQKSGRTKLQCPGNRKYRSEEVPRHKLGACRGTSETFARQSVRS